MSEIGKIIYDIQDNKYSISELELLLTEIKKQIKSIQKNEQILRKQ